MLTKKQKIQSYILMFVCFFVYFFAQVSKNAINANANSFIATYGVTKADVGISTSAFLICYGIGQIVNGIFCKKYNIKLMLSLGLLVSCACTLTMFFDIPFEYYKYLSGLNGLAQSTLWVLLLLKLNNTLHYTYMGRAGIFMLMASGVGALLSFGVSTVFSKINFYKGTFLTAAVLLFTSFLIWVIYSMINPQLNVLKKEEEDEITEDEIKKMASEKEFNKGIIILIVIFAIMSALSFSIGDGLKKWTPAFLKEFYQLEDWLSILISLLLPAMSIFEAFLGKYVYKKLKSFNLLVIVFASINCILFIPLLFVINVSWVATVVFFILICVCNGIITGALTSYAPLYLANQKINSGFLGGLFNGFAYLGSALVVYIMGLIADRFSWYTVFPILFGISGSCLLIAIIYEIVHRYKLKKKRMEQTNE